MSVNFGDISINTASDWVAADVLFRAELQSINTELSQLSSDLEKAKARNDEAQISDLESKLEELQTVRNNVIDSLNDYCEKRREKLQ